jgi:tetratricopeptide (TPR) repeat protein
MHHVTRFQSNITDGRACSVPGVSPAPEEVRDALGRMLSHDLFLRARRSAELLRYLVEMTLDGRGEGLKEYVIGTDIFGRDSLFDPQIDAIVRTEAWRLRGRLVKYYVAAGEAESVEIAFTHRSLRPIFRYRRPPSPVMTSSQRIIAVVPVHLSDEVIGAAAKDFCSVLVGEVVCCLTKMTGVEVRSIQPDPMPELLILHIHVRVLNGMTRTLATLVDGCSGAVRISQAFQVNLDSASESAIHTAHAIGDIVAENLSPTRDAFPIPILDTGRRREFLTSIVRASFAGRSRSLVQLRQEIRRLERAIEYDPDDRIAHRGLIAALSVFLSLAPSATMALLPKLRRIAERVLALDGSLSDVCICVGLASSYAYDWDGAEAAFIKSSEIDPLDPSPHILRTVNLLKTGRTEEALQSAERAACLEPYSPLVALNFSLALSHLRCYPEAIKVAERALAIDRDFGLLRLALGEGYLNMGDFAGAIAEFEAARGLLPDNASATGLLGLACARGGQRDRAERLLDDLKQSPGFHVSAPTAAAMIYIGLDAPDHAFGALEQAVRARGTPELFLGSACFDSLRADRRFSELRRQMGAPMH